ncbi:MAG: thioredoxin family protein [Hydrogenophaga sp.]|nr:thioredoxin family protein [Hydrogenophaga sp.]
MPHPPTPYATEAPTRAEIDALPGATVLEFGTDWCGFCRGAQPHIQQALAEYPGVRHLKVEDGPGRPLGRSFGIKLWPTLVLLKDGQQLDKLVRPSDSASIRQALQRLDSAA